MALDNTAGKGLSVNIKGKDYKLGVLTIDDLAEFESYIKSQKLKQFLEAAKDMPPEAREGTIGKILDKGLTGDEMTREMTSMSGVRFLLWRSMRKSNLDLRLEEMGGLIDLENFGEVADILKKMGGKLPKKEKEAEVVKK